eukprot:GGOE01049481.1.p1 GENE.GGOE01049481.1~~GGOE01049481.1.p1  ORF type:complete len:519 (+),score=150.87 GGOE01049481.1:34-1557(+)
METSSTSSSIDFTVKFQKQTLSLQHPRHATVMQLKEQLQELLDIPPVRQKLLLKVTLADHLTLEEAGVQDGCKVLLMASSSEEVATVEAAQAKPTMPAPRVSAALESQKQRQRAASSRPPRIHRLEVLDLPDKDFAMQLLKKLQNDLGIQEILEKHHWHVGLLKELSPLEQKIAGYNRNFGAEIAVKLRNLWDQTWRSWPDIMETMLHELAHCRFTDHDANFHQLNRQLNQEVNALDWTKGRGTKVGGDTEAYNPEPQFIEDSLADAASLDWREATKRSSGRQLGGDVGGLPTARHLTPAQMAARMAEIRLSQREQALVESCGCGKPPASPSTVPEGPSHPGPGHGGDAQVPSSGAAVHTEGVPCKGDKGSISTPTSLAAPEEGGSPTASASLAGEQLDGSGGTRGSEALPVAADTATLTAPTCPVCGSAFPPGVSDRYISNHVGACLSSSLDPPSAHPMDVDGKPTATHELMVPAMCCPLCGLGFAPDASERFMSNHVEQCLASAG